MANERRHPLRLMHAHGAANAPYGWASVRLQTAPTWCMNRVH